MGILNPEKSMIVVFAPTLDDDFSLREPVLHFGIYVFLEHLLSKKLKCSF